MRKIGVTILLALASSNAVAAAWDNSWFPGFRTFVDMLAFAFW